MRRRPGCCGPRSAGVRSEPVGISPTIPDNVARMMARLRTWLDGRRAVALAAAGVVLACAATAGSTPRPDGDLSVEAVARATRGGIGAEAFAAVAGRLDPAQLALAS